MMDDLFFSPGGRQGGAIPASRTSRSRVRTASSGFRAAWTPVETADLGASVDAPISAHTASHHAGGTVPLAYRRDAAVATMPARSGAPVIDLPNIIGPAIDATTAVRERLHIRTGADHLLQRALEILPFGLATVVGGLDCTESAAAVGDDRLLIVTSDRLSAFDVILPDPIPGKGEVLTRLSLFWFERLGHVVANHLTGIAPETVVAPSERSAVAGRAMVVKKLKPLMIEAVVRGYLIGSGWKDYRQSGAVCGIALPPGLALAALQGSVEHGHQLGAARAGRRDPASAGQRDRQGGTCAETLRAAR